MDKVNSTKGTKRRRTATIGGTDVSSLLIQGRHTRGAQDPDVPDYEQIFPISFSGIGLPMFTTPIKITSVVGDLRVTGNIYAENIINTSPIDISGDIVIGSGTGGNLFTMDTGATEAWYNVSGNLVNVHIEAAWSSKNGMADTTPIYLHGLPLASFMRHEFHLTSNSIQPTIIGTVLSIQVEPGEFRAPIKGNVTHTTEYQTIRAVDYQESGTLRCSLHYHIL